MSKEYPWGKGTVVWTRDAAANNSDKSFTTGAGKVRRLVGIEAELTATATVGNRYLTFNVTDGTNVVYQGPRTAAIVASQVGTLLASCAVASTTNTNDVPKFDAALPNVARGYSLPELILPAGYVVRVWDVSAVDAAADDLVVVLHYVEYDA